MKCQLDLSDVLTVTDTDNPRQILNLDMSQITCRLFETTRAQCHDYLEEILQWSGEEIENFDYISNDLMHLVSSRRRYYGFTR